MVEVKGLRYHKNADKVTGTKLTFPNNVTQSGLCSTCIKCGECEIGKKAKTGQTLFPQPFGAAQFGAEKRTPNLEDLQILPELYGEEVVFRKVKTETMIGKFKVKAPLAVAAMGSTIVAHSLGKELAEGAAKAGILMSIGENVIATYGKEGLKNRIQPFLDNYEGYGAVIVQGNGHDIKMGAYELAKEYGAHAIEVKFGQGAKQGLGGEIKVQTKEEAEKYKQYGYHIEENPDGTFQRHSMPGALTPEKLKNNMLKYAELDMPIFTKTGNGRGIIKLIKALDELKKENGVPIQSLTIDGFGGGTGMSPWLVMNEMNIDSASVFNALDEKPSFDILLAGGHNTGFDVAKGMMLGSKGSAMGRAFLIAANTDKEHGVENFVEAIKEELQMAAATMHLTSVDELIGRKQNLIALNQEASTMFGVPQNPKAVL